MNTRVLLKRLIELAGGPAEHGYVLALMRDTLGEVPATFQTDVATYTVVRPTSEIGLRHTLWRAKGAPILAIVEEALAKRLPADLVYAARGARVHAVETSELLSLALKTQVQAGDDEGLQQLALEHVNRLTEMLGSRTLPTVVDQALLDELLADIVLGHEARKLSAAELLVQWVAAARAWKPAELALLRRHLPKLFALEGRVLAWVLGDPKRIEELLVRGTLLLLDEHELPKNVWGELFDVERAGEIVMTRETFRRTVRGLVRSALDRLGLEAHRFLERADSIARRTLTPSVHRKSQDLPLGLKNRCEAVASQAEDGQVISHEEIQEMRAHRFASAQERELQVLEDLARLTRYLGTKPYAELGVADRVRHYQRQGAYADLAAGALRAALASNVTYRKAAEAVLARYRERRNAENMSFAELLRSNYSASLHSEGCTPLHKLWREAPVRAADGSYNVYLVVLDGCSYPVFLRLLGELASDTKPIGLRADAAGEAHGTPALAPVPTITSHARSAIFLGEIPKDPFLSETVWRDQKEAASDPARFKQNSALGARKRRLFLKGQLADHGEALIEALRDTSVEAVAAVFNAVDDHIGSSNTGAHDEVHVGKIRALLPSLHAALDTKRRVVVTADHGHTPFWGKDPKEFRVGDGSAARYRILAANETPPPGFIELAGNDLAAPVGRKAFAWKLGVYQGQPQVGFHGGCSLEEMVVPLAELTYGGVAADEPAWWYGGAAPRKTETAAPAPGAPNRADQAGVHPTADKAPAPKPVQGKLFDREELARTGLDRIGLPAAVRAALDPSEQAALACVFLNKSARVSDVARMLGRPPARVVGLLSRLLQKLHEHGFPCLGRETLEDGENLYRYVPQGTEQP